MEEEEGEEEEEEEEEEEDLYDIIETLFPNAELNLLSQGSGCPLQAGTGHGRPGRAPGRC